MPDFGTTTVSQPGRHSGGAFSSWIVGFFIQYQEHFFDPDSGTLF
jgi:hypothetical protein